MATLGATLSTAIFPTMVLIEDKYLSAGDAASFDFTSIPATYTHLKLLMTLRSDRNADGDSVIMKINNDAGNNYVWVIQYINSAGSPANVKQVTLGAPPTIYYCVAGTGTANYISNNEVTLFDYAQTSIFHSWQSRGYEMDKSAGTPYIYDGGGQWGSTSAINQITLTPLTGTNWKQYSRVTLYGLK
jgi:hypothetical protein